MAAPKPLLPAPNPRQPIGSTSDNKPVTVDQDWQQKIDALVQRLNDHEKRLAALEP